VLSIDSLNATEIEVMKHLLHAPYDSRYLYKISKGMGRAITTIFENLEKLENKGLIFSTPIYNPRTPREPTKVYNLTDFGEVYAWVFDTYPHGIMYLYKKHKEMNGNKHD